MKEIKLEDLLNAPAEDDNFFNTDLEPELEVIAGKSNFYEMEYSEPDTENIPDYLQNDPEVVGYPDIEMQDRIYKWVLAGIDFGSIKDIGCGRGDLYPVWKNRVWPNESNLYVGIDRAPALIKTGKIKYPEADLRLGDWQDFNIDTDYTVCIGAFSDYSDNLVDHFWDTVAMALTNTKRKVIVVFNTDVESEFGNIPLTQDFHDRLNGYPFELDCSLYEGIAKLTIYCNKFQGQ